MKYPIRLKSFLFSILTITAASCGFINAQSSSYQNSHYLITLPNAVKQMLEHEPELNAAEYDTLSTIADFRITRAELRPQVTLNSTAGFNDRDRTTDGLFRSGENLLQRQIGVSVRQLLYDGGFSRNNLYASRNANLAQQLTEKSQIESRVVDLSEVFLEIIRVRRQIALAQRNVDNHSEMRDMLRERALAGGSRADVGLVQGRLSLAHNTLSTQKLTLELAVSRFERLTGIKPNELVYPYIPSLPASNWDQIDISQNFDLLATKEALEAAEHRFVAAQSRQRPRIFFDANVERGRNTLGIRGEDNSASALIVGEWDLSSGGRNKGLESREHYQVGKYEELVRAAKLEGNNQLRILWQERVGSENSINALSGYAEELAQVNSDYEEQFRIGRQELLSILDIQQEHYSATSRLLDAKFDKDESTFRIMGVQGTLTKHLVNSAGSSGKSCAAGTNCHPDNRVPLTQAETMAGTFDAQGPLAEVGPTTRQAYYVEKAQLPFECNCDGKCDACRKPGGIKFGKLREVKGKGFLKFHGFKKLRAKSANQCVPSIVATPVR